MTRFNYASSAELFGCRYYENPSEKFSKLIYDFCVKDDKDLKESILKIATKIDAFPDREEYLNKYN